MSIVIEMIRKQVFTGEVDPKTFVRTATNPETLALLSQDQLEEIINEYSTEYGKRLTKPGGDENV